MKILDIIRPLDEARPNPLSGIGDAMTRGIEKVGGRRYADYQARKAAEKALELAEKKYANSFRPEAEKTLARWSDLYGEYISSQRSTGGKIVPFKQAVQQGLISVEKSEKDQIVKSGWLDPKKEPDFIAALNELGQAKAEVKLTAKPGKAAGEVDPAKPKEKTTPADVEDVDKVKKKKDKWFQLNQSRGKILDTIYALGLGLEGVNIWRQYAQDMNAIDEWEKSGKIDPKDAEAFPSTTDPDMPPEGWITATKPPYQYKTEQERLNAWCDYRREEKLTRFLRQLALLGAGSVAFNALVGKIGASKVITKLVEFFGKLAPNSPINRILQAVDVASVLTFTGYLSTLDGAKAVNSLIAHGAIGPLYDEIIKSANIALWPYGAAIQFITKAANSVPQIRDKVVGQPPEEEPRPNVDKPKDQAAPAANPSQDDRSSTSGNQSVPVAPPAEPETPAVDLRKSPPNVPGAKWLDRGDAWENQNSPYNYVPKPQ